MSTADVLVDGEAPESEEEEGEEALPEQETVSRSHVTVSRYGDVLHRKLRDKNQLLRRQLKAISLKPFASAIHSVSCLNEQMLVSGRMIEDVASKLKKVSSDMKCLTVCLDHLSEVGATAAATSSSTCLSHA